MSAYKFSIVFLLLLGSSLPDYAQQEKDSRLHPIGNSWGFYQDSDTTQKKRVLLIGDSILGGYLEWVKNALGSNVSVDYWITGLNERSAELFPYLRQIMLHGPYDVIHFNIGLHGWAKGRVEDSQYATIMQQYVSILKKGSPKACLIWATTTPVTVKGEPSKLNDEITPIIVRRNKMALKVMKKNHVKVNDLYSLMQKNLSMALGDMFHWRQEGVKLEGNAVAGIVRKNLSK